VAVTGTPTTSVDPMTSTATSRRRALRVALPAAGVAAIVAGIAVHASAGGGASPALSGPASGAASAQALSNVRQAASRTLAQSATFSMTLTGATVFGAASSVNATGSFDFRDFRGVTSVAPPNGVPEKRAIYGAAAVYTRPGTGTSLPPGKSWIVSHFSDAAELGRNFPQFVGQVESLNPGLTVTELAVGSTSAVATGSETVDGLKAARYDVTVDLRQALAGAAAPAQLPYSLALESGIAQLAGASRSPASPLVAMRVWVTPDARLLRVDYTPPTTGIGAVTMTLSGYGTTVLSDPPPADQVVDLAVVTPSGERENSNGGDADGG
jgi:hypothetical protein